MTSQVPKLAWKGVTKQFGDRKVLDQLDLSVAPGRSLVIIGGSGSGKTTLLRLIVGLDRPTAGEILLHGVDLSKMNDDELARHRTRFAMVFQKYALLDSLTVFDNDADWLRSSVTVSVTV